ncbi:alkaline phosphatase family protein [Thermorudis peleae]|uniref:alkaline phosphatase family protein n=1 Tax=Thermorudis peleae TaxID=1382356 RepID=UPI000690D282|nr:alkaline phosphatase family protein [Thermorudis peleae]
MDREQAEELVRAHTAFGPTAPTWVRPSYDGLGITNLPWSILNTLDVPLAGQPIDTRLWPNAGTGIGAILLLIIDGLGYLRLQQAIADGLMPGMARLAQQSVLFPLTSVFPSTTAAALTTLATGEPPARHGLVGFTAFLREFGMLSNLLFWAPIGRFPSFASQGLDPRDFLPVHTIAERAQDAGVTVTVVSPITFRDTPLTKMHASGAHFLGYRTPGEFVSHIHAALAQPGRQLVSAYWDSIDHLGHFSDPASGALEEELQLLDTIFADRLLTRLPRRDLLVILTADHGMVQLDRAHEHSLTNSPLLRQMRMPPGGERRAVYCYAAPGEEATLTEALAHLVGEDGWVVSTTHLLQEGLFGPPPHHPETPWRVGDIAIIARGPASFPYDPPGITTRPTYGAHAGLEAEEQLVPCLIWRP